MHEATLAAVTYRNAEEADARAASRLIMLALHNLDAQAGRPPREQPEDSAEPALRHLVRTDPERFWLAEAADPAAVHDARSATGTNPAQPVAVGFGAAMVRGSTETPGALWFLAGLFVHPHWQQRGVGRALLERTLAGYPVAGGVLAVATSAANAQSNTLYARHGMYPALPLLSLSRTLPATDGPADTVCAEAEADSEGGTSAGAISGTDLAAVPIAADARDRLRAIDLEVLGVDRTVDHEWLLGEIGRTGWLFLRAGAPVGYGYLGGDGSQVPDQVGPIAALVAGDQPAMAAFLLDRAAESGWPAATFVVPGANQELQRYLWAHGFAMSGTSELFGASRPFGRFDRYAFVGDALM